jgi:hypothetical protein
MKNKWLAINLLLLVIAVLLGWYVRNSIYDHNKNIPFGVKLKQEDKPATDPAKVLPAPDPSKVYNLEEFLPIAEAENVEKPPEAAQILTPEDPPLAQKPILVGTSLSDDDQLAFIIDPTDASGGIQMADRAVDRRSNQAVAQNTSRRVQIKRVGDAYQGYTITHISADNIVLERGSLKETISLHDGSKQSMGGKTAIQPTRVVIFGKSMGTTGGTSPARGSGSQPRVRFQPNAQPTPGR